MKRALVLAGLLAMLAGGSKGQTIFEPLTTLCNRTLENSYCSNVPSADGAYAFSFNGGMGTVAVYQNGALMLTASDLKLTVTQVNVANYYDNIYRVEGTFSGGAFTVYMEEITRRSGAGRYVQTSHYSYLNSTFTDSSGTVFTSDVTLN